MNFIALLLLLFVPQAGAPARPGAPAERTVRVAGTRVTFTPPEGFVASARFTGYALEEEGAAILITEMPFALSEAAAPLIDPGQLKVRGMTLLSKESVQAGGETGLLLGLRQSVDGAESLKWVLLVGDAAGTLMVTANFPAESEGRLSAPLRRSVLTARRDRAAEVADGEGLGYTVGERGSLKLARRVGHILLFTGGGLFPSVAVDNPLFVAGPDFAAAAVAGDRRAFAERRALATSSLTGATARKTEPLTVDGLSGYETLADAKDKATGEPMVLYQALLFDGPHHYLMQGFISRARADAHLPSFKEMARTFKRK